MYRYEDPEIALSCGTMLRECIRYEVLAKIILFSEDFFKFFEYVEMSTFDIASDAFATFKVLVNILQVSALLLLPFFNNQLIYCYRSINV